jgi:hypothetical protein
VFGRVNDLGGLATRHAPENDRTLTSLGGGGPNGPGDNIRRHFASRCRGSAQ